MAELDALAPSIEASAAAGEIPSIEEWLDRFAAAPAGEVAVFQNVYSDQVIDRLDASFLPVDGRRNVRTDSREAGLFLRMFHSGLYRCAPLTGIVSPKFAEKTRLRGSEFIEFVRHNPGYDVYFINPFPQNVYFTYNVWYQGELCHPGLAALAQMLFAWAGYDAQLVAGARDHAGTALYSSYWVGGRAFWEGYVAMLTRLLDGLDAMPPRLRERYLSRAPNYPDPVPILTFILERSFSAFLHLAPELRALAYPFARESVLRYAGYCDRFEQEIVSVFGDLVDEIDRRREYTEQDREVLFALTRLRAAAARLGWR